MRIGLVVALSLVLLSGCRRDRSPSASTSQSQAAAQPEWFTDRAQASGLDFVHFNGMSGEFYYPEIMAPGVALLDYDNDGDLDVFVVQGRMLGAKAIDRAWFPPPG